MVDDKKSAQILGVVVMMLVIGIDVSVFYSARGAWPGASLGKLLAVAIIPSVPFVALAWSLFQKAKKLPEKN
ncbi:MAG: hypothetical protein U0174_00745 [Polyangiaceae bacterium]